jgi:uncharacterized RDD family membrane protein YckC
MSMMMEEHHYAGFWIRLFARIIDLILILATFNLFYLVDQMGADKRLWTPSGFDDVFAFGFDQLSPENILRIVFFALFPVFYYVYLHGAYGQTFGKMALRIKVLNEDGTPLDYRKAFLRWLGYFLCDLTLNIGYLWAAFDPRKQGLHDKVCRTVVIHENARTGA